jgi:hypothetical protein
MILDSKKGLLDHFHHHGYVNPDDLVALLTEAGLKTVNTRPASAVSETIQRDS